MQYFIVSPRRRSRAVLADDAPVWRMPSFNILSAPVEAPVCRGVVLEARDDRGVGQAVPPFYGQASVPKSRRGVLELPETLKGTALVFGKAWLPGPVVSADYRVVLRDHLRVIVAAGALDQALADVKAGRLRVPLLVNHDPAAVLAYSDDGSFRLRLAKDAKRVRFCMDAAEGAGRLAAQVVTANGLTGLSLCLCDVNTVEVPEYPLAMGVLSASIRDVSFVSTPRCPGCRLEL